MLTNWSRIAHNYITSSLGSSSSVLFNRFRNYNYCYNYRNANFPSRNMSYGSKAAERLANKTILITGASSGIGQATAVELATAANGNIKLILAARRADRLEELKKSLESTHPSISILCKSLDVTKVAEVPEWVSSIPSEFADVDVLINNAGMVLGRESIGDIAQPDIETMFNTNVLGLIALTQQYVPKFRAKNSGDVVMLGSIAGRDPYPGGAIYCATKAAVRSFTEILRKESIDTGIRVMEIQPGQVETEFSSTSFFCRFCFFGCISNKLSACVETRTLLKRSTTDVSLWSPRTLLKSLSLIVSSSFFGYIEQHL